MAMRIRVLSAGDVEAALPMPEAIEVMASAFAQFSAGKALSPLRSRLNTERGVTLLMPAYLQESRDLAVKIVSVYEQNEGLGLPVVSGAVLAIDPDTGIPLALMEGGTLTALRTGAAGGLAAKLLAREDASTVVLFGAGVQGRSQLLAAISVRPIERVFIVDPNKEKAEKLAQQVRNWAQGMEVKIDIPVAEAVQQADIVIAATTSKTPLFNGNDLRPGTHVTGIGSFTPEMQEIGPETVTRAKVFVDSREACLAEAGDIIKADAQIEAEIGDVAAGRHLGRSNTEEITFFKSVGLAVQDAAAAGAVLSRAEKKGLGTVIDLC